MKRILQVAIFLLAFVPAMSFAQETNKTWPELKAFHSVMSATFHPAEEGNLAPIKERAGELFAAVRTWRAAEIPADFKKKETKETLISLEIKCGALQKAVEAHSPDADIKLLLTEAHDIFHKIVGECRRPAASETTH